MITTRRGLMYRLRFLVQHLRDKKANWTVYVDTCATCHRQTLNMEHGECVETVYQVQNNGEWRRLTRK